MTKMKKTKKKADVKFEAGIQGTRKEKEKKETAETEVPGGALQLDDRKNMEKHAKEMLESVKDSDSFLAFVCTNKDGIIRYRYVTLKYPIQDMLKAPKALRDHVYNDLENAKK